jgi:hypothetical protein
MHHRSKPSGFSYTIKKTLKVLDSLKEDKISVKERKQIKTKNSITMATEYNFNRRL